MTETSDADDDMTAGGDPVSADHEALYPAIPQVPDRPSYSPILTGLGIAVMAWGFLTDVTIGACGVFLFSIGLSIWIKELTSEPE